MTVAVRFLAGATELPASKVDAAAAAAVAAALAPPPPAEEDEDGGVEVKDNWEEYDDAELAALAARGEVEVRLQDGETRRVRKTLFNACRGTPLHAMLFDARWGGDRGSLACGAEVFDDICAFLRDGATPPMQPRQRWRSLWDAADYYCLQDLLEVLDDLAAVERARRRLAAKQAEALRAAEAREAAHLKKQQQRAQRLQRMKHEERAAAVLDRLDFWASTRHTTKAHRLNSVARSVQHACRMDLAGGTRGASNRQNFYTATNAPKSQR